MHARLVLTDSGGIQEETTVLGVPCLTLRSNTERPVTIQEGTNTLVGTDPHHILSAACHILHGGARSVVSRHGGMVGQPRGLWPFWPNAFLSVPEAERHDGVRADHRSDSGPTIQ
jgi:hypothetical protein